MSDAELLRAIWDDPHDDELRLVYADHLDRSGDPQLSARADFIRIQCGLARAAPDDPARDALERRERHLWMEHRKAFRRGLPSLVRSASFERGFAAPVIERITGHRLLNAVLPLLPDAPAWNVGVRAIDRDQLATLFASEHFGRITKFRVGQHAMLEELARSPHAHNLASLHYEYTAAPARVVHMLGALRQLRHLYIGACKIGDDPALVAAADFAPRLETLDIRSAHLDAPGVAALFGSGRFARLAELDLSYATPGDVVIGAFATSAVLPALRRLRIYGAGATHVGARALAAWPGAPELAHLDFGGNFLGLEGLRALLDSPQREHLQSLTISKNDTSAAEIERLLLGRFAVVKSIGSYLISGMQRT